CVRRLYDPIARPRSLVWIRTLLERCLVCFRSEDAATMFLLPPIGWCIHIGKVHPASTRQENPGGVAGHFGDDGIAVVDRSAICDSFMRHAFSIRLEQAADRLVASDCGHCLLARERVPTRDGNKGKDKSEPAALPNSHRKDSMNEAQ